MPDKPILFSGPMVRAILDGRKTQTRRVLKPQPAGTPYHQDDGEWLDVWGSDLLPCGGYRRENCKAIRIPYAPGDRLWVRETWTARMEHGWTIADARSRMYREEILFKADGHDSIDGWWPSIHMPREFSRLTLIVTDVRVQRLQDISEADALAEGVTPIGSDDAPDPDYRSAVWAFEMLWDSLNAARGYGWDRNPWVAAVSFQAHRCNIDKMEAR